MTFSGINYIAVIIATLAGFGLGAVWYMALGGAWMRALGKTKDQFDHGEGAAKALPFIISLVALFLMAWMLAGLMGHLGDVTVRGGAISGLFIWVGFVITTMGVNHAFSGAKPMLTLIDGGHWLAVLLVMGAVIGAFGV
ncbi:DUF1761 domain-containing protein [Methyloceanibacter marginalis]|jgi:uncharacterized protein DUF1761|uniref:DUF1761 domain-containing protein n=1 Tax=Methyloceanibacter marginalis TaxID=1774971 RepID=UPI00084BF1D3|nr:DUF1761 domain-containing protein [Methyloceanibacter marginalis]